MNDLYEEYNYIKNKFFTKSGARGFLRVQRDNFTDYDTVSEGIAYGILLSAIFNDNESFDMLYSYAKLYISPKTGCMDWKIDKNGIVLGSGSATDADEDICMALVIASNKFKNTIFDYKTEAKNYITNLFLYCVEKNTNILIAGDGWINSELVNPSYFAPAWYKVFAKITPELNWMAVVDSSYNIIDNCQKKSSSGLVQDWCDPNGISRTEHSYYLYDAIRVPWRLANDYIWFGDKRAKQVCDKFAQFFKKTTAKNIVDGYDMNGNIKGKAHSDAFVATAACSFLTSDDTDTLKEFIAETHLTKEKGEIGVYYNNFIRLLCLLLLTNEFDLPDIY